MPTRPREHELKTWPRFFAALLAGTKTFEVRPDDRGFRVGDSLHLREWHPRRERYTGRECWATVSYILTGFGVADGHVAMALKKIRTIPR